jgi:hypothetical protein
VEKSIIERWIGEYELKDHFSPQEMEFLDDRSPTKSKLMQFSWRIEAAWVLLWTLGFIDKLGRPENHCNTEFAISIIEGKTTEQIIANATMRKPSEILDAMDLIYRYRWAIVDARINEKSIPGGLDSGVAYEWHYALNWLVGYLDQEWDEITTDT